MEGLSVEEREGKRKGEKRGGGEGERGEKRVVGKYRSKICNSFYLYSIASASWFFSLLLFRIS